MTEKTKKPRGQWGTTGKVLPPVTPICSICQGEIDVHPGSNWTRGHNAAPVNAGRCCTECNTWVVIPARIKLFTAYDKANPKKGD